VFQIEPGRLNNRREVVSWCPEGWEAVIADSPSAVRAAVREVAVRADCWFVVVSGEGGAVAYTADGRLSRRPVKRL